MHKAILYILCQQAEDIKRKTSPLLFGEQVPTEEGVVLDNLSGKISKWWDEKDLDEIVQSARLAGLLHDIGHGPFGHTFEDVCRKMFSEHRISKEFNHSEMAVRIINERLSDRLKPKGEAQRITAEHITEILKPKGEAPTFLHELIDGPYDCDKLDYLMRDAYHAGVEYGIIDCTRILEALRVYKLSLCISKSALDALLESFHAVQLMYTTVYYHKTSRIFDFMIAEALQEIPDYIEEVVEDVDKFLELDDARLVYEIRKRAGLTAKNYERAYFLLESCKNRQKLYKEIFWYPLSISIAIRREAKDELADLEEELAKEAEKVSLKIIVDYRPEIRPVGVSLIDLYSWLAEPRIFDPDDRVNPVKALRNISFPYYQSLRRYVILFRVFADRNQCDGREDKVVPRAKKRIEEIDARFRE